MKKISKKLKIIIFVATILVVMILAIVIIENITKENNLENKGYLETISNADSNLIASYIKEGVTIGGITGTLEMLDTSDATATEDDVIEGKTFYAGSNEIKTGIKKEKELHKEEIYNGIVNDWEININVKNILPSVYNQLTKDNFGITNSVMEYRDNAYTNRGPTIESYDPITGILYVYSKGTSGLLKNLTVAVWYVE